MPDRDPSQSVQEVFLAQLVQTRAPVTAFLTNGVKLQGRVANFDRFCLMLTRAGHAQLVFKRAISTVMPSGETEQPEAPVGPSVPPPPFATAPFRMSRSTEFTPENGGGAGVRLRKGPANE